MCKSSRFSEAEESIPRPNSSRYTAALASRIDTSELELLKTMKLFTCELCHTNFQSPFFSRTARLLLYKNLLPDHAAGWANFLHTNRGPDLSSLLSGVVVLNYAKSIRAVSRYAEVNCPFMGIAPLFVQPDKYYRELLEVNPQGRFRGLAWRLALLVNRCTLVSYRSLSLLRGVAHRLKIRWFKAFFSRLLEIIPKLRQIKKISKLLDRATTYRNRTKFLKQCLGRLRSEIGTGSLEFVLLSVQTTSGWGLNCVRFGTSCNSFVDVVPLEYAIRKGERIDCVFLSNTLDHLDNPLQVLSELLCITKLIIVRIHCNTGGSQHGFFFTNHFFENLSCLIPSIKISNIRETSVALCPQDMRLMASELFRNDQIYAIEKLPAS